MCHVRCLSPGTPIALRCGCDLVWARGACPRRSRLHRRSIAADRRLLRRDGILVACDGRSQLWGGSAMAEQHGPDPAVIQQLHAQGERLTPQRLLVLETLQASGEHLTADEVYALVSARFPYVGRATIYRVLTWLKDQGLISVIDLGRGQVQYQYLSARRHHHLVCLGCGHQEEFSDDLVAPFAASLANSHGFKPRLDHLAVFGLCQQCQVLTPE